MSELGETYAAWNELKKEKKRSNLEQSISLLDREDIYYDRLSDTHLRLASFDFWPSTGLYIHRRTKKRGRGIKNLIKRVKEEIGTRC